MKKVLFFIMLFALSASAACLTDSQAFGNSVDDFINEVLSTGASERARSLVTDEKIMELINSSDDINAKGKRGDTVLMVASAFNNNPGIVKALIKDGANVNAKNDQGWTALMSALANDANSNSEIIKILIEAGADVKAKNNKGITARDLAKRKQNPEIQRLADTLLYVSENPTADLFNAVKDSRTSIEQIKTLINAGADVNAKDKSGNTVFMNAAKYNSNVEIIKFLIAAGVDLNAKNNKGQTVEDLVKKNPNSSIQKMAGVLNFVNDLDNALINSINSDAKPDVISALVELGANVNAQKDNGETILMTAAEKTSYPEVIEILINAGIDVNAKTKDGNTALNYAAKFNKNSEVVRALVNAGAELEKE